MWLVCIMLSQGLHLRKDPVPEVVSVKIFPAGHLQPSPRERKNLQNYSIEYHNEYRNIILCDTKVLQSLWQDSEVGRCMSLLFVEVCSLQASQAYGLGNNQ